MARVLIVVPHDRFRDEELQALISRFDSTPHQYQIGSTHHTEAKGHFGMIVKPDVNIGFVESDDYDALIFIGGRGVEEYVADSSVINLVRKFYYERRMIAAIGLALEILVNAGVLSGVKVSAPVEILSKIQAAGAFYTGKGSSIDKNILTAEGIRSKDEFAEAVIKALDNLDPRKGLRSHA